MPFRARTRSFEVYTEIPYSEGGISRESLVEQGHFEWVSILLLSHATAIQAQVGLLAGPRALTHIGKYT